MDSSNEQTPAATSGGKELTPEQLIERLCRSLKKDGDFPASAKVVTELRRLSTDPRSTGNQITELILREPSLGARILHIVNSSFYRRATPIMTVSQAVMRIGTKQVAELSGGLVLLQKFVPQARKGGAFSSCFTRTIMTPLLSTAIAGEMQAPKKDSQNESGYLAGLFAEMGTLLLAYYFPQVYENAVKRSDMKRQDLSTSLKELTGVSQLEISAAIMKSLDLPEFYGKIISHIGSGQQLKDIPGLPHEQKAIHMASQAVQAASAISGAIASGKGKTEIDAAIAGIKDKVQLDLRGLQRAVGKLPDLFEEYCKSIDLDLPALPGYVATYSDASASNDGTVVIPAGDPQAEQANVTKFIDEIRQAVNNKEPTASIITTVMETLAWALNFDRVALLLVDPGKKSMRARMMLGKTQGIDPKTIIRPVGAEAHPQACDARAFSENRAIFTGSPVLPGGWPVAALPVGFGTRVIGVLYADRVGGNGDDLPARDQAAIGVLADLLDKSISSHSRSS
jgi:HD-like signal output (HDOD) protein